MLRLRWLVIPLAILSFTLPWPHSKVRGETIQCTTGDSTTDFVVAQFHVYRPGQQGVNLRWRDLEFMWAASYPGGLSFDAKQTLEKMASTLVDQLGHNPFGAGLSKIHLVYNYFSVKGPTYDSTNPYDSTSVVIARSTAGYNNSDKSHVDYYLESQGPSKWPAFYVEAYEDTSTGHPVNLGNPALTDVKPQNSISGGGPLAGSHIDLTGNGWTHPDSVVATAFTHEFEHSLNPGGALEGFMMDEMFAQAAEAICGRLGTNNKDEVPYTWPLLYRHIRTCIDCCSNPRDGYSSNYFGRNLFTAYLAYNFRGADTLATALGLNDDLLRRWSRRKAPTGLGDSTRHWSALVELLGDDSCGRCVGKNYFRAGGSPLPRYDRAQLLLHNWRVANYVNRSDLPGTEGQYGFPPQFGFSPGKTFKAWQAFDGCGPLDDLVAVPPVVTLTGGNVSQEMNLRVKREFRGNWYPMTLKPTGAEYWVIRADTASLGTMPRDLVITVSTDSIFREKPYYDGRLMASVVAYTHRAPDPVESPQWQNPQWATLALEPKWADADSLPAELVFVVPSFGLSYKAAVVVITLADGPSRAFETTSQGWDGVGSPFELPYRVALALRGAPNDTLANPRGLHVDPLLVADSPTWSPASDEVAFTRFVSSTGESRVYRQRLDGSPAVPLATGTAAQSSADWSPRGDWMALSQPPAAGPSTDRRIWVYGTGAPSAPRELTSGATVTDLWPAFQPNGQTVAYARLHWYFDGSSYSERWQLRRINLDGTQDVPLIYPGSAAEIKSLRWSPDGWLIYFTRNDSLYAISRDDGAIVAHPEIMTKVTSFDFHLSGTNRLVAEESGNAGSLRNPQYSLVPFRRLVLRDVAATDTRARFYRTGAEFYNPRWSPDGLRVAYSSNQNTANSSADRDLFVGQVSFNRPPSLLLPSADLIVHTGRPYELYMIATDPDGEAITYEVPPLYRPSGASFTPATRRFYWPNPGPVCSENYVIFRAFDASGGVASRVVKITAAIDSVDDLNADVVGDDEIWVTWTAPGDNGSLGRGVEYELRYAQIPLNEATFGLGTRVTGMAPPAVPGTTEVQSIGGLSAGTNYYIAIRTKDARGNWSVLSNILQAGTTSGGGGSGSRAQEARAPLMELRGAESAISRPGVTGGSAAVLAVEMGLDGGAPVWSSRHLEAEEITALGTIESTSVLLQARDPAGTWLTRARILVKDAAWRFGVRAPHRPGRLVFIGPYGVRQAWNSVELDGRGGAAGLVGARHSRLGDVKSSFDLSGSARLEVGPSDTLTLAYEIIPKASGTAQDWYLLVGPPGSEVSTPVRVRPGLSEEHPLPRAFALRQNRPNPFSSRTTIHFDLPVESLVRLEIFDAQGRLVRTLAREAYPAGFHALEWDHRSNEGNALGAGVYLYRIQAGRFHDQKKMVLVP